MGISRYTLHKKKLTGGKKRIWRKKRKHELARPPAGTKIGIKQISLIRVRGGNIKKRALRLDHGNFSLISSSVTRKARIISVVYNASNNELVRTNTLVKGSIIFIDATPFKNWFEKHQVSIQKQNKEINLKENKTNGDFEKKKKLETTFHNKTDSSVIEQVNSGKLLARICSRPGQTGRCDGYVIEGSELEFYLKKIQKKKF